MKTIKLSEESYNKLKNKLINEISYGTVDHAYNRANDLFWEVRSTFEDFYSALDDAMFNATQGAYLNNKGFFMEIEVPTFTPLGKKTYRGYFMSSHSPNCTATTDPLGYHLGHVNYDELHEDVEFSFVQK